MGHAVAKLLDDFRALPGRVERPRTFMDIAGYPHYENVCSNILAFFLDPGEPHGLGTLVLDALASAGSIVATDGGIGANVSVEREVSTEAGNRIDILIESDTQAVLIENKIFAAVGNPFADYAAHLKRRTSNGCGKHKILLTLFPTGEGKEWGFANLTYAEFVDWIRSLLGRYVSSADTRYLTMFLDFLNTLESLQKGTRMDQEFVKLLAERGDEAENLFAELTEFKKELRKKVQELGNLINVGEYQNIEQWFWRERTKLYDVLVHDIRVAEDLLVGIDTAISSQGWEIDTFVRRGGDRSKLNVDRVRLRDLLQYLEVPFEERQGSKLFVHAGFDYVENLVRIRPILQDLVDKLAVSQEREE